MAGTLTHPWQALNWPNRISLLRVLGVPPFVVLLLNQHDWPWARHAAMAVFVVMGLSDALDGYLARRSGQITRLGKILDPLADKLLIICSVILLATDAAAIQGAKVPDWVVVSVVGKDLWVVIGFVVVFFVTGKVKIRPTWAGKACTMGQIMMVAGILAAPDFNRIGWQAGSRLAMVLGWVVMVLCLLAVISYTRLGLAFMMHGVDQAGTQNLEKKESNAVQSDQ